MEWWAVFTPESPRCILLDLPFDGTSHTHCQELNQSPIKITFEKKNQTGPHLSLILSYISVLLVLQTIFKKFYRHIADLQCVNFRAQQSK